MEYENSLNWPGKLALAGLVAIGLVLAISKVKNEHAMTKEYFRQAEALERIAAHLDGKKDAASCSASIGHGLLTPN